MCMPLVLLRFLTRCLVCWLWMLPCALCLAHCAEGKGSACECESEYGHEMAAMVCGGGLVVLFVCDVQAAYSSSCSLAFALPLLFFVFLFFFLFFFLVFLLFALQFPPPPRRRLCLVQCVLLCALTMPARSSAPSLLVPSWLLLVVVCVWLHCTVVGCTLAFPVVLLSSFSDLVFRFLRLFPWGCLWLLWWFAGG